MLTFYHKYQGGEYSQNGEAGIIDECIKRIALDPGTAIEFGAPTMQYCSNIYHLRSDWTKLYYDINPQDAGIMKTEITPANVNDLPPCSIISMDTDGMDYEIWKAYKQKPVIVIIEINSSLDPLKDHFSPANGANYSLMLKLGIQKDYFLVCHTGNLIFVLNKYRKHFPEIVGNGLANSEQYFNPKWL